jgi:hypothetical protein
MHIKDLPPKFTLEDLPAVIVLAIIFAGFLYGSYYLLFVFIM